MHANGTVIQRQPTQGEQEAVQASTNRTLHGSERAAPGLLQGRGADAGDTSETGNNTGRRSA